jgi:hypothetical protein
MSMLERWHNENTDPLMRQWEALRDRGAPAITPVTQESLWRMRQELAAIERAKPQPPRDEMLLAARSEFRNACHRYRRAHTAIVEAQEKLRRRANDPVYGLLFDMTAALRAPVGPQDMLDNTFGGCRECSDLYLLRLPEFASVSDYRSAMNTVSDRARDLEAQQAAITTITAFPGEETNARTDRMVTALVKRINELERLAVRNAQLLNIKVDRVAGQVDRIAASARYIRKNKQRSSK